MADANDPLSVLQAARKRMVEDRHNVAKVLAEPWDRQKTPMMMESFKNYQAIIDSMDRAIEDEGR